MLFKALLVSLLIYFILRAAFRLVRVIALDGQEVPSRQVPPSRPMTREREPASRRPGPRFEADIEDAVWKDL
jgi:hypothetical protein